MLTIAPLPRRFMSGTTACAAKKAGRRLTATVASNCATSIVAKSCRRSSATLLTSTPMSPKAVRVASTAARSSSMFVTSPRVNRGGVRASARRAASACAPATSMSTKPTLAPCAAKARTMSAPMPVAPPVMNTGTSCRLG